MNCERPHIQKGGAYGCGSCLPCRIQRRRIWTHRILLEAAQYEHNTFVTLTYGDDHLPAGNSLLPGEVSSFVKRLRKGTKHRIRYYACGEYGEITGRPHYHIALFNYHGCEHGITRANRTVCCSRCDEIQHYWGKGIAHLGLLEKDSAQYIAGYVSKKYTTAQNYDKRQKPFTRMSLRPGIGAGMMDEVASTILQHNLEKTLIDVPVALQHGSKQWPLGRYLRRYLRERIGRPKNAPQIILDTQEAEMQTLRETALTLQTSTKAQILAQSLGKRIQIHSRHRRAKRETV